MKSLILFLLIALVTQSIPYKPNDEFEIKLDYQFKQRSFNNDNNVVNLDESRKEYEKRTSTDLLPYLILKIKFLKLSSDEMRVRITNNREKRITTKKALTDTVIPLDLGFTDDVKDRVNAHEYILTLLSPNKSETSRIVIHIEEDGSFFVNGEKRGKF